MRRALPVVLLVSVGARALGAQAQASLGAGIGTVRYPGGSALSSAAFSPSLQYAAPTLTANLSGSFASLPQAVWSAQGRGDVWAATPAVAAGLRFGAEGIYQGTTRTDGGWTAAVHGVGELLWTARNWGVGVGAGPSAGWIANQPSVTALHTRARAWWQLGAAGYAVSVEPTRFLGAWFTDVSASVTTAWGPVMASLWGTGRISPTYGSKAAASALVQLFVAPTVALEVGGGGYLPDPYQGLPRAAYVAAGVRIFVTRASPAPPVGMKLPDAPLVRESRNGEVMVRFRMEGATSVAIAGDWTDWQPTVLQRVGGDGDEWEGALPLGPGTYHFNLVVDGKEWVVPNGVATVSDGFGGMAGVLTVR